MTECILYQSAVNSANQPVQQLSNLCLTGFVTIDQYANTDAGRLYGTYTYTSGSLNDSVPWNPLITGGMGFGMRMPISQGVTTGGLTFEASSSQTNPIPLPAYTLNLYSDSAQSNLVATATASTSGLANVLQANSSGISGTINFIPGTVIK